jgi:hypothetical protein
MGMASKKGARAWPEESLRESGWAFHIPDMSISFSSCDEPKI